MAPESAAQAHGQVIMILDQADNVLGAFSRKLFLPATTGGACEFGFPLSTVTKGSDGTYLLEASDGQVLLRFPKFSRASHTGSGPSAMMCRFGATANYQAVLRP